MGSVGTKRNTMAAPKAEAPIWRAINYAISVRNEVSQEAEGELYAALSAIVDKIGRAHV